MNPYEAPADPSDGRSPVLPALRRLRWWKALGAAFSGILLPVPLVVLLGVHRETIGHPHGGFDTEIISYHLPHQWLVVALVVTCLSIALLCLALVRLAAIRRSLRTDTSTPAS